MLTAPTPLSRPRSILRLALVAVLALPVAAATAGPAAAAPAREPAAATAPAPLLENGLARTPPMGFNNWNTTHCRAEFNEEMIKGIADYFVSSGLKAAGYQYVNIDDCWALPQRGADGNLVPDPARFPGGIKALADYVHERGLKFGIYTSAGTKTCNVAGFPGGLDHEQQDADLFASWGVDYLKYDNCNNQGRDAIERYTRMRDALARTGRPIVYSICEWGRSTPKVWTWGPDTGNLWRTTGDISDNWNSLRSIISRNLPLAQYAKPGAWNDPDMLEIGNGGMTDTEYRTHFSMWSVMAAPLLIGSDLRTATPETMNILLNKEVIAVDQDPLGIQGAPVWQQNGLHVVAKRLLNGDRAVALYNETDRPATISTTAAAIGLPAVPAYRLRDLWAHTNQHTAGLISANVPAHGTAFFRVGPDPRWPQYPPVVGASITPQLPVPGSAPVVTPGEPTMFTTAATNHGALAARVVQVNVTAPAGWLVRNTSPRAAGQLPPDAPFTTNWRVFVPAGAKPGSYDITAEVSYLPGARGTPSIVRAVTTVIVAPLPPSGTVHLSDVTWLTASNGFGPVERNTSNGERPAGDGKPITIRGAVHAKGLGVHSPSEIEYYTGGKCTSVQAIVGIDDETAGRGGVAFQVLADGRKVADSGLLTGASPAHPLTADVTGASIIRLVVTDGGDGPNHDHADWADLKVSCT